MADNAQAIQNYLDGLRLCGKHLAEHVGALQRGLEMAAMLLEELDKQITKAKGDGDA